MSDNKKWMCFLQIGPFQVMFPPSIPVKRRAQLLLQGPQRLATCARKGLSESENSGSGASVSLSAWHPCHGNSNHRDGPSTGPSTAIWDLSLVWCETHLRYFLGGLSSVKHWFVGSSKSFKHRFERDYTFESWYKFILFHIDLWQDVSKQFWRLKD